MSSYDDWSQSGFLLLVPPTPAMKPSEDRGPFTFAYTATGKLKSFFAGKPYPNEKGDKVQPPAANASAAPGEERPLDESTGPVRLAVFGNANFTADEYLRIAQYVPNYAVN